MGSIFVAMATTFALGAESNRLPACMSVCLSRCSFKLLLLFLFLNGIEPFLAISFFRHSTKLFLLFLI